MEHISMKLLYSLKRVKTVSAILCVYGYFGLGALSTASASPSSNIVWDSETRNLIKNADLEKGAKIAKKCGKCHGDDGTDPTSIEEEDTPFLAGQIAHASYKQIVDYQDKKRDDKTMQKKVKKLSKQDIADVSAFYQTQALPTSSVDSAKVTADAIKMATKGAGERFLPPCAGCHGLKGEGSIVDVPALAGQNTSYFITTMMAFKEQDRENDIYSRMRFIAEQLSEKEITELADYYASIGTGTELLVVDSDSDDEKDDEKDESKAKEAAGTEEPEAPK
jgi:cytochrome c553